MNPYTQTHGSLGAGAVTEAVKNWVDKGIVKEWATTTTLPPGMPEKTIEEVEKELSPWYKKWWVWALAGTGAVGIGYLGYRAVKR